MVIALPWSFGAVQFSVIVLLVLVLPNDVIGSGGPNVFPCCTVLSCPFPNEFIAATTYQ